MKYNILFVDDETNVLQGMKRMLFSMRKDWAMFFANSGDKALEILSQNDIDIIISDMRMPGMNGLQLLTKVMNEYPRTMRIVLSGQADNEQIIKSVLPIHQFLSKPCKFEIITDTIKRVLSIRTILSNEKLVEFITKRKSLPSLPDTYKKLMRKINSPTVTIKQLGQIISEDIGMTAKVLQLVNSSFFGFSKQISDPVQASIFLGIDTLKALTLTVGVFSQYEKKGIDVTLINNLWTHSMLVGNITKELSKLQLNDMKFNERCFISGMLHDIGKLILIDDFYDKYKPIIQNKYLSNDELTVMEKDIFGACHTEIGAYLLGLWGFSEEIINSIFYHHQPLTANITSKNYGIALLSLYIADLLAQKKNNEINMELLEKNNYAVDKEKWQEIYNNAIK